MPLAKTLACCTLFITLVLCTAAQQTPVYVFQKDENATREKYYQQALANKESLINSLGKEHKKDYKEIYEARFKGVEELLKSSTTVTEPVAHAYLQSILKKIVGANPALSHLEIRLVFTRDSWPNAYSTGEGTLAVNAGLVVFFENESQLAFTICHELAHLYLDHGNKEIRKNVELVYSDELKKEAKQLAKQQYGVGQKLEELFKKITFMNRRHSREDEAAADRQAFTFLKNTGYDCNQAKTCLQLLDRIDDTTLYQQVNPEALFSFGDYPFKKKWIQKESSIFAAMSADDSPLTPAEKDSLKTHPDCIKRIALLEDSLKSVSAGKKFIVDEQEFHQLKKQFIAEMAEQQYRNGNLGYHLYLCLQLLQKEEYKPYAAYAVVRCLNRLYQSQKNHTLGLVTDKESRTYPADYNLVLRMLDKLRLDEIANLSFYFGKAHVQLLSAYDEFAVEMKKAENLKREN
jgi:Zn-dependent protease with chaperone function